MYLTFQVEKVYFSGAKLYTAKWHLELFNVEDALSDEDHIKSCSDVWNDWLWLCVCWDPLGDGSSVLQTPEPEKTRQLSARERRRLSRQSQRPQVFFLKTIRKSWSNTKFICWSFNFFSSLFSGASCFWPPCWSSWWLLRPRSYQTAAEWGWGMGKPEQDGSSGSQSSWQHSWYNFIFFCVNMFLVV